jgi:hypothetical protein
MAVIFDKLHTITWKTLEEYVAKPIDIEDRRTKVKVTTSESRTQI